MEGILENIISFLNPVGFLPLFFIGLLVSLFLFWKESFTHKDRNSVFDMWFLTILFAMLWGRVSFIIANWEFFDSLPWAIAPYERYGEEVYFLRLLPWKFFDLRDGGFLFTGIFSAYITFAFFYNIFVKKWRWREMFLPVILSAKILLVFTLIAYGVASGFVDVVVGGFLIAAVVFVFLGVIIFLRWLLSKNYKPEILVGFIHLFVIAFTFISFSLITYLFFSYEISLVDKINVYVMNFVGIILAIYFVFIEKEVKETGQNDLLGGKKSVTININRSVKIGNE
jgi:hypothetical protein